MLHDRTSYPLFLPVSLRFKCEMLEVNARMNLVNANIKKAGHKAPLNCNHVE
jgi:hypothetical protein